ncbi:MAG: glutamine synthetase family protein [Paracoccaceae bacterium]
MTATNLAAIVTTDLTAITRGRFLPAGSIGEARSGVGWVPANLAVQADGAIAAGNRWGTKGDLRLIPDPAARYVTGSTGASTPFDMSMADLVTPSGEAWPGCARTQLRQACDALEAATGLHLRVAFEHEFQIVGDDLEDAHVFSYQAMRQIEPFAGRYFHALEEAGIEPETILAEYGMHQFEITSRPAGPITAADRAVATREITREMCRIAGMKVSFAPMTAPDRAGNGVHVHFSLTDAAGKPVGYDPAGPGGLSRIGGAFCAGILAHTPAMLAYTAPSPVSYLRLKPQNWTPLWAWLAEGDRGTSLRICPVVEMSEKAAADQFNLEFRAADATANPYLVLAALIRAGLDGIERDLVPTPFSGDPDEATAEQRAAFNICALPASLDEALRTMQASAAVMSWFPEPLAGTFVELKRMECRAAEGLNDNELCAQARGRY